MKMKLKPHVFAALEQLIPFNIKGMVEQIYLKVRSQHRPPREENACNKHMVGWYYSYICRWE